MNSPPGATTLYKSVYEGFKTFYQNSNEKYKVSYRARVARQRWEIEIARPGLLKRLWERVVLRDRKQGSLLMRTDSRIQSAKEVVLPGTSLTDEQKKIITSDPGRHGGILKVKAYAGTGKTKTLELYAHAHPNERILYVAFNKSVELEARKRFPANTTVKTINALAYQEFGHKYANQLQGDLRPRTIENVLGLKFYETADAVKKTLSNFLRSADRYFKPCHAFPADTMRSEDLLKYARQILKLMGDREEKQVPMTHEGYLKIYHLSDPDLRGYDTILFDEAQDANPVDREIIVNQPVNKIFIGDPHQQIYAWRGAEDALGHLDAGKTLYLTNSFRFDDEIAGMATSILRQFKELEKPVKGVGPENLDGSGPAVLHRTFAECFDSAVEALEKPGGVWWCGGIKNYDLDKLLDLCHLYTGDEGKINSDYFYYNWDDYEEYKAKAIETQDFQMLRQCSVVEKYEVEIPALIRNIREDSTEKEADSELVISTVHRAKGKEWDEVSLAEDFFAIDPEKLEEEQLREEVNLLYVAITRARKDLSLCSAAREVLAD